MKKLFFINFIVFIFLIFGGWSCQKNLVIETEEKTPLNEQDTFYLSVDGIKVSNGIIEDISFTSVTINADFSAFNAQSFTVENYGHVISSINEFPTIDSKEKISELGKRSGLGQFKSTFEGLIPNTIYYARVYIVKRAKATGEEAVGYHPRTLSFKTKDFEKPKVETIESTFIDDGAFTVKGKIEDFKETDITTHGFVWIEAEKSLPPTLLNNDGVIGLGEVQLTSTHTFESLITGLKESTVYHISAFATNAVGTDYGRTLTIYGKLTPSVYSGIPNLLFNTLYIEDYKDNLHDWFVDSQSGCSFNISGGTYNGECNGTNFYVNCKSCLLEQSINFQIEVDIAIIQAGNSCSINWGGNDSWRNTNRFGINGERKYIITSTENSQGLVDLIPLTPNGAINQPGSNKLTVRNLHGTHFFFINEVFLFSTADISFYGNEITLRTGDNSRCKFDNLTVEQIKL